MTLESEHFAERSVRRARPHGYGLVLGLIVVTYVLALLATRPWMMALLLLMRTATAWQALRTSHGHSAGRRSGIPVRACRGRREPAGPGYLDRRFHLLDRQLALPAHAVSIVRDIGFRRAVDRETMLGALSAYLLIGMAFGFAYQCMAALQPGPLFGDGGDADLARTLFFSFVTMTTTGYGDLVPASNPGQSVAVLEALLGQLFLVTAVAKVVENGRPLRWRRQSDEPAQGPRQQERDDRSAGVD